MRPKRLPMARHLRTFPPADFTGTLSGAEARSAAPELTGLRKLAEYRQEGGSALSIAGADGGRSHPPRSELRPDQPPGSSSLSKAPKRSESRFPKHPGDPEREPPPGDRGSAGELRLARTPGAHTLRALEARPGISAQQGLCFPENASALSQPQQLPEGERLLGQSGSWAWAERG